MSGKPSTARISSARLAAFAGPAFVTGIMFGPGPGILSGMYAKYYGVSLAGLGTALLVGRLFDAITDPAIGFLSVILVKKTLRTSAFSAPLRLI